MAKRLLALLLLFAGLPAAAQGFSWTPQRVEARVLAEAVEAGRVTGVVALRLDPGWATYWPAGNPEGAPRLDFAASDNVGPVSLAWPVPTRIRTMAGPIVGYEGRVLIPFETRAPRPGWPIVLHLRADLVLCSTVCVPETARARLEIPDPLAFSPSPEASEAVGSARRDQARPGAAVTGHVERGRLVVGWPGRPDEVFAGTAGPHAPHPRGFALDVVPAVGESLDAIVVEGTDATDVRITVVPTPGLPWEILLAALLGGLVLNVMPCVLPVLALKAGALARGDARRRRRALLANAAGIVLTIGALGAVLAALGAAGVAVGWGMHLQSPLVLAALVVLMTGFAAVALRGDGPAVPAALIDGALAVERRGGTTGDVATGVLAALLATPCSAPFLGAAAAFAVTARPEATLLIFLTIGIGFALPQLVLALRPGILSRLPRAGRWTVDVKIVLAGMMVATAGWLWSLLLASAGTQAAAAAALAAGAAVAAVLLRRLRVAAAILVGVLLLGLQTVVATGVPAAAADPLWKPFRARLVEEHLAAGRTVVVDVTADWCVTCKVNDALVLSTDAVRAALGRADVVALRADWTRQDASILAFLRAHGRAGIPFLAVFHPDRPVELLPELLTADRVLEALEKGPAPDVRSGLD